MLRLHLFVFSVCLRVVNRSLYIFLIWEGPGQRRRNFMKDPGRILDIKNPKQFHF